MAVDSLQVDAAVLDSPPHQSMHYRRADDNYVGSSSIGGIRLKPGIAKGNVCRFRDHVVAEIAGGILKEARAPIAIDEEIGRAHVCTPVTNATLVCRLLLDKK